MITGETPSPAEMQRLLERAMRCAVFHHAAQAARLTVPQAAGKPLNCGMDKTTLYQNLNALGVTLPKACALIHMQTGAIIVPHHIHVHFTRSERLSEPMSALFAYFFRVNRKRMRHGA